MNQNQTAARAITIADPTGHLAEVLFSQAIAEANPMHTARPAPDPYVPDTNNLDVPAFLRKRTLRDFERRK